MLTSEERAQKILLRHLTVGERINRRELQTAAILMEVSHHAPVIAEALKISSNTASQHLYRLRKKCGFDDVWSFADVVIREYWQDKGAESAREQMGDTA